MMSCGSLARFSAQSVSMMPRLRWSMREQEAALLPEVAHRVPELVGRAVDHQPALRARALHAHVAEVGDRGRDAGRVGQAGLVGVGRDRAAGHRVAVLARQLRQVGRHFERWAPCRRSCSRSCRSRAPSRRRGWRPGPAVRIAKWFSTSSSLWNVAQSVSGCVAASERAGQKVAGVRERQVKMDQSLSRPLARSAASTTGSAGFGERRSAAGAARRRTGPCAPSPT